jgi:competence protein ComEC
MDHTSWSTRPAVRIVLLLTTGILLSDIIRSTSMVLFALFATTLIAVGIFYLHSRSSLWTALALHLLVVVMGLFVATMRRSGIEKDVLNPRYNGEKVTLDGRIASEPIGKGTRTEMLMSTKTVGREGVEYQIERQILIQVARSARWENSDSLEIGDIVRLSGTLEPLPGARNPGEFDYGRYLALNGVQGFVSVRDTNSVHRELKAGHLVLSDLIGIAQNDIYRVFDRYHKPEEASFLKGVVFGYRGDLSAEIKQSFMDTGTIHILAVSGSNVVVVGLIFYSIIGFFRVSQRTATALTLLGLLWYMVITGMSPSVIRATIMGAAILVGTVIGRKADIYNSLAVAALVMLLWDPMFLRDVGFLLSFTAVISIVYFYPRIEPIVLLIPQKIEWLKFLEPALKLFAVSVAAQLGTIPFTAYFFGRVSLISVLANLLVVPLSGVNTLLGFATIAFSFVSAWMASSYAALNDLLVSFLLKFVMWSSKVPYAYVETLDTGVLFAATYSLCVAALFHLREPRYLVKVGIVFLIVLNCLCFIDAAARPAPSLSMTAIDVGQGDALLLEFPNMKHVLVDAGPTSGAIDAGQRNIAPFLKRKGIASLDAIILTHPHDDHVGGCRYLLENFNVRRLIVGDTAPVTGIYREVVETARRHGVPIELVRAGMSLQFDLTTRILVLHPTSRLRQGNLNNQSIVLKAVYGSSSLLLMGDAEWDDERWMVEEGELILASNVLKAGHHGSSTSSTNGFLRSVHPSLALISVGRFNKFHHPSPRVVSRYREFGMDIKRTDLDGAIVVQSDGTRFKIVPWRRTRIL